jgi:acetyl-CoA carboxylase biotin carboxyl carrier protein
MSDLKATAKRLSGEKKVSRTESSEASLNLDEIREIAKLVDEHGFTDFEFENDKIRVRLSKQVVQQNIQLTQPPQVQTQTVAANPRTEMPHSSLIVETEAANDENLYKITSPIVGTFYSAPSPEKAPYVSEGDIVNESSVVCIVEAMKLMNEIQAEVSGEIVKIYVESGQPVEYGQPLFGIRK